MDVKGDARLVPHAAVVAALHAEYVLAGYQRCVGYETLFAAYFVPGILQPLQHVPITIPLRVGIAEARELDREDVLLVRERQCIRVGDRLPEHGRFTDLGRSVEQTEVRQGDGRNVR